MNKNHSMIVFLLAVLTACLLGGCSAPKVKVSLSSTATLNMNEHKEALPVVVRIYQLRDNKAFESATFDELWKSETSVLGNQLLRKEILTLDPASQQKLEIERHDQAQFVGVMAAFHNQADNNWRVIKRADRSFLWIDLSTNLEALLQDNSLRLVN
ncbi:type VI secretion system lipoprotein TssJ [Desulfuromonas sp. KJ2020]|uniref:type VI secretion system lipoprotein TssJ n=1 Tax=Desulfuromonas sp. KJ2020 TaxID=2919173 RepID=UPI0020A76DF8|nr:type VI secretion system lipoprotein TssJ [Desulfuromonas sp. KJ2020]MCP3176362.1 type VI secretion system lipoprotein TssJ [Desulfuromonas sp. KJ2020]